MQGDRVEASGAESGKPSFEAMGVAHQTPALRRVDQWIKPSSVCHIQRGLRICLHVCWLLCSPLVLSSSYLSCCRSLAPTPRLSWSPSFTRAPKKSKLASEQVSL